jgi:ParB-like chromosome segregation protein Spo0J
LRAERGIRYPCVPMTFKEIHLEEIDFSDETFRISENLDPQSMRTSLSEVGQLSPVVLVPKEGAYQILCGFRRARALRDLGRACVSARIFPDGGRDPLAAFRLALWDNIAQRELEPLEKARALFALRETCRVDRDTTVAVYLPVLGLKPHRNVLDTYLNLHTLSPLLRQLVNAGQISTASAERMASMSPDAQEAVADLLEKIRLSASLQREVLGLIEDLAAIMNSSARDLLGRPEIRAIATDSTLSPFQRGERIRETLFRWRNPRLSGTADLFLRRKLELNLPGTVRLLPDPFFETTRLRVEFDVSSAETFRDIAAALQEAARLPALDGLFSLH